MKETELIENNVISFLQPICLDFGFWNMLFFCII